MLPFFKFLDYFESVNRVEKEPFILDENSSYEVICKQFGEYEIKIDLEKLIKSFPYRNIVK